MKVGQIVALDIYGEGVEFYIIKKITPQTMPETKTQYECIPIMIAPDNWIPIIWTDVRELTDKEKKYLKDLFGVQHEEVSDLSCANASYSNEKTVTDNVNLKGVLYHLSELIK